MKRPTTPAMANGCNPNKEGVAGSEDGTTKSAELPKKKDDMPPIKLLDRRTSTGMTGNGIDGSIEAVMASPVTRNKKDTKIPTSGPAMAKSNKDFKLGGGDRSVVMAPVIPKETPGMRFGIPTSNYMFTVKKQRPNVAEKGERRHFVRKHRSNWIRGNTKKSPSQKHPFGKNSNVPYPSIRLHDAPIHEPVE